MIKTARAPKRRRTPTGLFLKMPSFLLRPNPFSSAVIVLPRLLQTVCAVETSNNWSSPLSVHVFWQATASTEASQMTLLLKCDAFASLYGTAKHETCRLSPKFDFMGTARNGAIRDCANHLKLKHPSFFLTLWHGQ